MALRPVADSRNAGITPNKVVGTPGTSWRVKAAGDFNGDGKADIVLQNTSTGDIAEWQINGFTMTGAVIASPGTAWVPIVK